MTNEGIQLGDFKVNWEAKVRVSSKKLVRIVDDLELLLYYQQEKKCPVILLVLYVLDTKTEFDSSLMITLPEGKILPYGFFNLSEAEMFSLLRERDGNEPVRIVLSFSEHSVLAGWQTYISPSKANQGQISESRLVRFTADGSLSLEERT